MKVVLHKPLRILALGGAILLWDCYLKQGEILVQAQEAPRDRANQRTVQAQPNQGAARGANQGPTKGPELDACGRAIEVAIEKLQKRIEEISKLENPSTALEGFKALARTTEEGIKSFCDQVSSSYSSQAGILQNYVTVLSRMSEAGQQAEINRLTKGANIEAELEKVKLKLDICRHKLRILPASLERILGWQRPGGPESSVNKLKIIAARFGDLRNERRFPWITQTCNALPYVRMKCSEAASGGSPGATYCVITRNNSAKVTDFCGYDPSPQGEKEIYISYECGGIRTKHTKYRLLPADATEIAMTCEEYPTPADVRKRDAQEIEQERKFLAGDPCPVVSLVAK